MPFVCSICGEPSSHICTCCTKDACANHLCIKCHHCSDCCDCEDPLTESAPEETVAQPVAPLENAFSSDAQAAPLPPLEDLAPVGGTDSLATPEPVFEPTTIPAEDVAGEAPDENLP